MMTNTFNMVLTMTKIIECIDKIELEISIHRFDISTYVYDTFKMPCLRAFCKYAIGGNEKMTTVYENSTVREIEKLGKFVDEGYEIPHFIWGEVGELMSLLYELNELDSNS